MLILCKHLLQITDKIEINQPSSVEVYIYGYINSQLHMYQQVFGCVLMYTSQVYAFSSYVYNNLLSVYYYCYNQFISNVISCRLTDLVYISLCNYSLFLQEYPALHYAVKCDKLQCVKLLIQLGADVTKTDWVSHYYIITNMQVASINHLVHI